MLLLIMNKRPDAIISIDILIIRGPILSNPVDLLTLRFDKNFLMNA